MPPAFEPLRQALKGRYDLKKEIGTGGMATVFLAEDTRHGRNVAIKVLDPDLAMAVGAKRFLHEIEIASNLAHPHIVPLLDSGSEEGFVYFVMPYVEGETLRARLDREEQLPLEDALRITTEIADALSFAHDHGVVHRDVKPGNILLESGHAVLADFGVAQALVGSDQERLTGTGVSLGTPSYMSPEQAAGGRGVDGRSDVYSLGCVLYEMLTGDPPFHGRTAQAVIARHLHEEPGSIRLVRPQVPAQIETVIQRSLAKSPADRFEGAGTFSRALTTANMVAATARIRRGMGVRGWFVGAATVALATAAVLWSVGQRTGTNLDGNKVMVFPLADRGGSQADGGGVDFLVMAALGGTEPLRWLAGWNWLEPTQRSDPTGLTQREYASVARAQGAGHYINGQLLRGPDSLTVALYLFDVAGDSLVHQLSAAGSGVASSVAEVALRAIVGLLPALVDPQREVDLTFLTDRRPAAITSWLLGEREYRLSRFTSALTFYRRALEEDSAMAPAAIKGAQAAAWDHHTEDARALVDAALALQEGLPQRHVDYLMALDAYLVGDAPRGLDRIHRALRQDPQWSEAWMLGGEFFQHLLANGSQADSAAHYYGRSAEDPGFTPPLIHLADYAVWEGRLGEARSLQERLSQGGAELEEVQRIEAMIQCVDRGPDEERAMALATSAMPVAWKAAHALSVGARQSACALSLYRAIFTVDGWVSVYTWGAAQALQSLHVARGDVEQAEALLTDILVDGRANPAALFEAVLNEAAGATMPGLLQRFEEGARAAYGERFEHVRASCVGQVACAPWLLGVLYSARGDARSVGLLLEAVRRGREAGEPDGPGLLEASLAADSVYAAGNAEETIAAYRRLLQGIVPADVIAVSSHPRVALAPQRIRLAELCLAEGDYACAAEAAASLDHPTTPSFVRFAARALAIRREAALRMGERARADVFETRLIELGRSDLLTTG